MAVSPIVASFRTGQEPESPVSARISSERGAGEGDTSIRASTEDSDLIAQIIADLSKDCKDRFSQSHTQNRSRSRSYASYNLREEDLDQIRPRSRSRGSTMTSNTTHEMNDMSKRGRRTRRSSSEEENHVPDMMDSYRTSKRSSLSRSRPSSVKFQADIVDSAISLPKPTDKRKNTKSHLREARSASDEPGSPISSSDSERQDETTATPVYPSAAKTAVIMVSLYISIFLVALDRTIIGPAIPAITNEFNSIGDIGWYGSSYMLTAAGFILLYGRIYTFFPTKPVFLSGIFLFEIGSVVCGAAQTSTMLIIGRAIAGLGSSGIFTGAILIMLNTVPLAKRPMLQGLFGACFGVASVAGPLLGGAFTGSKATWRWW
jgi:hypothetical protein